MLASVPGMQQSSPTPPTGFEQQPDQSRRPKVLCVIGTRPEAIKMASVIHALRRRGQVEARVLLTGQHRQLLDQALDSFDLRADLDLDVMQRDQTLSGLAGRILLRLDPLLEAEAPDMVLAQGDTTTVMATAIASFHRRIRFGHVEAGLRTGNLDRPFPEEYNRVVASRAAHLHFAPTASARDALLREGVDPARVHVTGNTVIDALLHVVAALPQAARQPVAGERLVLMTLHRRESFGPAAEGVLDAVRRLCNAFPDLRVLYPVHPNPQLKGLVHAVLGGVRQVSLVDPLPYRDLVAAMARSTLVLTDSGGLQEEAPALGKPVLVLRDTTERPEAVALDVARLIGTDPERIVQEATRLLSDPSAYAAMAKGVSPYGDGLAAERIAALVEAELVTSAAPGLPQAAALRTTAESVAAE